MNEIKVCSSFKQTSMNPTDYDCLKLDTVIVEKVSAIQPTAFEEAKRTLTRKVTQMRMSVDHNNMAQVLTPEPAQSSPIIPSQKEEDPWERWSYDEDHPEAYVDGISPPSLFLCTS
jgi:hypothetical protein